MLELSASEASWYGVAFTVVGALIGALATVYAARITARWQHLYGESAKFRTAFVDELIGLRRAEEDAFKILSDSALAKHRKAKVEFEPWVPQQNLEEFELAWSQYEQSIMTVAPGNLNNRKDECLAALQHIEHLLSFAPRRG